MATMSQDEIETYLAERRHAIVATNTGNGPPQLSPVWYLYEEGRFYISVNAGTAKYRNLQRDPGISLCIDAGFPDMRSVIVYGAATLIDAADPLQADMRWRILNRYYQDEEATRRRIDATADLSKMALIVVVPDRITGWSY
jgi:PPOX class probable F420-dependent enzyme